MSYRCEACSDVVPHGKPCLRHQVLREDRSILREAKVCERCHRQLTGSRSLGDIIEEARRKYREEYPQPEPIPEPVGAEPLEVSPGKM